MIKITKSASKILNKIAHEHNVKSLLFYVKGGGCSGFNYKIEPFRGTPYRIDEIIKCENVDIIICSRNYYRLEKRYNGRSF